MKIHFKLNYFTQWGQNIAIMGSIPELANNDSKKALYMNFEWKEDWMLDIEVKRDVPFELTYKYVLKDTNGLDVLEWGDDRTILIDPRKDEDVYCYDSWNPAGAIENVFMTSPFQDVLFKENHIPVPLHTPAKYTHIFKVKAPTLKKGEVVCMVGDSKELGNWVSDKALVMSNEDKPWWVAKVNLGSTKAESINYKYGIYDIEDQSFKYFEYGADRQALIAPTKKSTVVVSDTFVRVGAYEFKGAGVGIPVFSIRTKSSFGVGDFIDVKLMVDWAKKVGLKLIQVLPLNDTIGTHTAADVLPYAAISAFALSPLYLNLPKMGKLPSTHPLSSQYKTKQKELNALPLVEFLEIVNFKLAYAKELYLVNKEKFLKNKSYLKFFQENEHWLVSYAAFCYLRDKNGTADHSKWGEYATFSEAKLERLTSPEQAHFDDIAVNYFIQYHLHLQLL
ncbi:MAG: 4-alpha-glucanotransferase, partial [Paludibacteraceae bacterium]|nr:4-alpha-glucanotransferase [Paludibacteraceae bacterium]